MKKNLLNSFKRLLKFLMVLFLLRITNIVIAVDETALQFNLYLSFPILRLLCIYWENLQQNFISRITRKNHFKFSSRIRRKIKRVLFTCSEHPSNRDQIAMLKWSVNRLSVHLCIVLQQLPNQSDSIEKTVCFKQRQMNEWLYCVSFWIPKIFKIIQRLVFRSTNS